MVYFYFAVILFVLMIGSSEAFPRPRPLRLSSFDSFGSLPSKEAYFTQTVDHSTFTQNASTFNHRYLYSDLYWTGSGSLKNGCTGPILFYAGNEGPIDAFWSSNGFMLEVLAPSLGALVIFAEERFYGKSLPFGSNSFNKSNIVYLTTEQVLSDYVELLNFIRSDSSPFKTPKTKINNCPIIAFGGSYGATLAAYLRIRYPFLIHGALAASPELLYYEDNLSDVALNEYTWIDIAINDYKTVPTKGSVNCYDQIVAIVESFREYIQTTAGQQDVSNRFKLCSPLSSSSSPEKFINLITEVIESLPQENYPYAIGTIPQWPINATCELLENVNPQDIQTAFDPVIKILSWYYGDPSPCWDISMGQGTTPGDGPNNDSWGYQSCTETLHSFSAHGWRTFNFNISYFNSFCNNLWGAKPDLGALKREFGGLDGILSTSNLIISSGGFDPWSAFYPNVFSSLNISLPDDVYLFTMPQGAHHLDLRAPNDLDPVNVTLTRQLEQQIITKWISTF